MRILFVTTMLPWARTTGSEICTAAFVDAIRQGGREATVLTYRRKGDALVSPGPGDVVAAERHIETRSARGWPAVWMASSLARREPYTLTKFRSRALGRRFRELLDQKRPDVVVVDHARMSWVVPDGGVGVPLVYLAHNVEHAVYRQAAAAGNGVAARLKGREARVVEAAERRIVSLADAVWTLTEDDAAALATMAGDTRPRTFALPPSAQVDPDRAAALDDASYDVGLIGSWTWGPNAAGLRWFVEHVHPHLPDDLAVAIAGAGGERIAAGLDYRGRVPDAGEFLHAARAIACPSVEGGGVQLKTLDAIATGRRVVATSVALRGLDNPPGTVTAADDPAAFAAAVVRAARTPDDGDGARALAWTAQRRMRFDADVAAALADVAR